MPKVKQTKQVDEDPSNQPKQKYDEVSLKLIQVSQTTPQKIRRMGFTEESLKDITESVRQKGVLEPILLRQIIEKSGLSVGYELVAGERRYLAASAAGLAEIPAMIKVLSDEEVVEIQLHENLHRDEPHPLEEAATYNYMETERGFDLTEIATRAAKSLRYVAGRKELLKLTEEVKNVFRKNEISLSHALEIAKYPVKDQSEILFYAFSNAGQTSQALYPMPKFIQNIEQHYLLKLNKAPFSLKDKNLRSDGMACVNCPDRTGAKQLLFDEGVGKNDSCLNRTCYEGKVKQHIQIQREKIVVETKNVPVEKATTQAKKVPLISPNWLSDSKKKEFGEPILERDEFKVLQDFECDKAEYGVYGDGNQKGQKVIICKKTSKCLTHWRELASSVSKNEKSAELIEIEQKERRDRKEEIIDVNVGEIVRRKVLSRAMQNFDSEKSIFNHQNSKEYLYQLTAKLWQFQCHFNSDNAEIIRQCLGVSPPARLETSYPGADGISKLTDDERARLLWLVLHVDIAKMYESGSFRSQAQIKQLAKDFEVDYQMIDAVERLKYASEKHEKYAKEFHNYLVKLENGERDTQIPRVYSPDYKPKE